MKRRDAAIYGSAVLVSFLGHMTFLTGMGAAARRAPPPKPRTIEMAMVRRPPPPPPPPPPSPPPEPPKPRPKVKPPTPKAPEPVVRPKVEPPPPPPPNTTEPPKPTNKPARPVFGISMSSTVGASNLAMPVGNTAMMEPGKGPKTAPGDVKPYRVVPSHAVSKLPRKLGDCVAAYPADAKQLGIEGKVVLDVEVLPDGRVGEVVIITGLGHGLDEAAQRALKRCKFAPAEVDGQAVGTRIQYVYTFVIED